MYGYIYITTNLINNKKYIGQRHCPCNNIEEALLDPYLGSGRDLKKAIFKYGSNNFTKEILELCNTKEQLNKQEKYWIDKYNAVQNRQFYNLASGGSGGDTFSGLSQEDKIKCRNLNKLHNQNRRLTDLQKQNISKALSDKQKTLEHLINEATIFQQKGWITIYDFTDILCYKDKEKTQLLDVYQKESFCEKFQITNQGPSWCAGIKRSMKTNKPYHNFYWDIDYNYTTAKSLSTQFGYEKNGEIFGPFYGTQTMAMSAIGDWSPVICTAINRVLKKERASYHDIVFFYWNKR